MYERKVTFSDKQTANRAQDCTAHTLNMISDKATNRERILFVNDDADATAVIKMGLTRHGFEVVNNPTTFLRWSHGELQQKEQ
jgi:PleD family two-component response regulator